MNRRIRALALTIAGVLTISSCASLDVNALPAPGNSFRDGYAVVMEFDNVLNLPARAKVTMDGIVVGIVTGVAIAGQHVDVATRIDPAVSIPSNAHAELQQATVLGDIYVAVDPPAADAPAAPPLKPGSRLPVAQTSSPPQLEDTIVHLSDFIGSGSIQRVQNTIINLNRITPPPADVRKIASQFAADIKDLSDNINTVDLLLNGVAQTGEVLHRRIPDLQTILSKQGQVGWDNAIGILNLVSTGFPSVGSVYSGGFWLVPLLNSLADTVGAIRDSKWAFESEVPKWRDLFTNYFLPQDKYPAINITSIQSPDGREMINNVQDVLRMLGGMP